MNLLNARTIAVCLWITAPALRSVAQEIPTREGSVSEYRDIIHTTARANFEVACLNVTRDAAEKRLRIYGITTPVNARIVKEGSFEIELIYHRDLRAEVKKVRNAGAYHEHHNELVLKLAAAEFVAGKKELGLQLARLLAEADPSYAWYSAFGHPSMTIYKIVSGLERDDDTVKAFLKEASEDWAYRVKHYAR